MIMMEGNAIMAPVLDTYCDITSCMNIYEYILEHLDISYHDSHP